MTKFRNLGINDTFDFIGPETTYNSFFLRCVKVGARRYNDENGGSHKIGSIDAQVYHVVRIGAGQTA